MAKKKKAKTSRETLEDLAELAGSKAGIEGFLDDELRDACDSDANLAYEQVTSEVVLNQLEFLYSRGWGLSRLKELIEEADNTD